MSGEQCGSRFVLDLLIIGIVLAQITTCATGIACLGRFPFAVY